MYKDKETGYTIITDEDLILMDIAKLGKRNLFSSLHPTIRAEFEELYEREEENSWRRISQADEPKAGK